MKEASRQSNIWWHISIFSGLSHDVATSRYYFFFDWRGCKKDVISCTPNRRNFIVKIFLLHIFTFYRYLFLPEMFNKTKNTIFIIMLLQLSESERKVGGGKIYMLINEPQRKITTNQIIFDTLLKCSKIHTLHRNISRRLNRK